MTGTRTLSVPMKRALKTFVIIAISCVAVAEAQSRFGDWGRRELPYQGDVTFVRLRWQGGTHGVPVFARGPNFWLHEFPRAEQYLMTLLKDFTTVNTRVDGSLILTFDDPQLFKHPVALMQEPGFWTMTDEEANALRAYLLKGGFLIFNDFEGQQWDNFEAQMRRVLPTGRWIPIDETHPIFDSFFHVEQIYLPNPFNHHLAGLTPEYFGLFEDNDPTGRLMAIANYNTNLAEYWQSGGSGFFPIEPMNNGFELGINYMMYSLTH